MARYWRGGFGGAVVLALVGGCSGGDEPSVEPIAEVSQELGTATCPDNRWIGKSPPSCPSDDIGAWSASRLFEDPTAPPGLKQYCLYEWQGTGAPQINQLPKKGGSINWLHRDCAVAATQSSAADVDEIVRPILETARRIAVESPQAVQSPASGTAVDVAIVDTWPSLNNEGRSIHGAAMAGIIDELTCGNLSFPAACPIQTVPRLALDRYGTDYTLDTINGGTYAFQGKVAAEIYKAVASQPGAPKRVVNLSIGSDAQYDEVLPGVKRHSVEALESVLQWARCQGALVIAAAGNATWGPAPSTGPTSPGSYEETPANCGPGPLVYSFGGVDNEDQPITNTRPGALPRLVAPSFAVPSTKIINGVETDLGPMTGTSLAAATGSALAALVWHFNGSLTPAQVMEKIRTSAEILPGTTADYCLNPPCGTLRRVSVCRTLAAAGAPVVCGATTVIAAGAGANPAYVGSVLDAIKTASSVDGDGAGLTTLQPLAGICSIDVQSVPDLLGPLELCPNEHLTSDLIEPSIDPQPQSDPCPACSMENIPGQNVVVDMPITERVPTGAVVSPQTLSLMLNREVVYRYDLGSAIDTKTGQPLRDGLTPGETYHVELPPCPVTFDAATIEWLRPDTFLTSYLVISER